LFWHDDRSPGTEFADAAFGLFLQICYKIWLAQCPAAQGRIGQRRLLRQIDARLHQIGIGRFPRKRRIAQFLHQGMRRDEFVDPQTRVVRMA